jgi:Tol biopolymer transport system component
MNNEERKRHLFERARNLAIVVAFIVVIIFIVAFVFFRNSGQNKPMVAYLYPFNGGVPNIWLAAIDNSSQARQVTDSRMGIYDFAVSKDGRSIAYSMRDENTRMRDIFLLDIDSGDARQITFCGDEGAECYSPDFHPENTAIAYVRQADNIDETHGEHANVENIWLLDIENGAARPLADDKHLVGYSPQWSPDGNTLAFYNADLSNPSIIVYNFKPSDGSSQTQYAAAASNGLVGTLAPDSLRLVFPELISREGQFFSYLNIADFEQNPAVFDRLTNPNEPIDDINAAWNPDGKSIAFARRYTDSRWTRGYQLYEIDIESREIVPLLYDEGYSHHYFEWDDKGDWLLVQRLPVSDDVSAISRPEIWVLNYASRELTRIVEEAYHPRWVNQQ